MSVGGAKEAVREETGELLVPRTAYRTLRACATDVGVPRRGVEAPVWMTTARGRTRIKWGQSVSCSVRWFSARAGVWLRKQQESNNADYSACQPPGPL